MKWISFFCFSLLLFENLVFADMKVVFNTMESVPYQGKKLKKQGFMVEISKESFKRVGYDLEIRFVPWKRAMTEAKSGEVNGVLGAWYNKERTKLFEYTNPIGKSTLVLLKRKEDKIKYNTLKDLKDYRIGVVRGYAYTNEFDKATFLKKEVVHSTELNLRKLLFKRIDLTPDIEEVVYYLIKSKFPEHIGKIESVGKPLKVHLIYNIISRKKSNYKKMTQDFNKGLKMIKGDGTFNRILKINGIPQ
ncbi:MAG: transporter substrate-binding domain-containing protein [Deltaproteobacteria bacterium]|nr:transporter substrate-binding domain-containing protein [Deltaproteobacteria bacterium]